MTKTGASSSCPPGRALLRAIIVLRPFGSLGAASGSGALEEVGPRVVTVLRGGHPLDGLAGLVGQPLWHDDLHPGEEVAGVVAALDPATLEAQDATARGAGCHLHLDRPAVERRHRDGRAECGLREGDRQVEGEVVAVAPVDGVLVDRHGEDQVTCRRAGVSLTALAAQANPLTVLDARGDAGVDATEVGRAERHCRALHGVAEADAGARLHVGTWPRSG